MESIKELFDLLLNSEKIIQTGSVLLIFLIVFLETGVIFAFFLPGDYLLFLAGMYATTIGIPVSELSAIIVAAAILGYILGYLIGRRIGVKLYHFKDSRFFKRKYLDKTEFFFKKYGRKSLMICRFLPVIRTFMPVLAGVIKFPFGTYMLYNVIGGLVWVLSLVLGGYYLVDFFPQLKHYVQYIILFFISITTITVLKSWWELRKKISAPTLAIPERANSTL
jgi:membrane-associated protein